MTRRKIAIVSYGNCPNLGDRIGQYIIFNMLPYNCEVKFLYLPPFWKDNDKKEIYDLVIIGTGHSIFYKTLENEDFLKFLRYQKKIIGVFGLQYHDLLDMKKFQAFTNLFNHIFVRNKKDLEFFSQKDRISHSGDILTSFFPLSQWTDKGKINIKPGIVDDNNDALSIIKKIQTYKTVESSRLHPLLAGLQSCDEFIFYEQKEMGENQPSNKFNNMLYDIFESDFKEGFLYKVDKNKVLDYRRFVFKNLEIIEKKIKEIFEKK